MHHCGAKHISKSKCTKHTRYRTLLEVEMSKKCTPLWREAHFEVKMCKTHQHRSTCGRWDVQWCSKSARCCGAKHIWKWKCSKHHMFAPLLDVDASFGVASAKDCAPCQKWAKHEGWCSSFKNVGRHGAFRGSVKMHFGRLQHKRHVHRRC